MGEPDLPPRLVDALSAALRAVSRGLQEALEREERVSLDQWRALRALSGARGRTMGELTDRLQIPAPSVTRLVDGLVDRAWVYRNVSTMDRRRVEVRLSDAGTTVLRRLEDIVQAHESQYRSDADLRVDALIDTLTSMARSEPASRVG